MSRTKCSFWKVSLSVFANVSYETLLLEDFLPCKPFVLENRGQSLNGHDLFFSRPNPFFMAKSDFHGQIPFSRSNPVFHGQIPFFTAKSRFHDFHVSSPDFTEIRAQSCSLDSPTLFHVPYRFCYQSKLLVRAQWRRKEPSNTCSTTIPSTKTLRRWFGKGWLADLRIKMQTAGFKVRIGPIIRFKD